MMVKAKQVKGQEVKGQESSERASSGRRAGMFPSFKVIRKNRRERSEK